MQINPFDCLAISLFLYLLVRFRNHKRRGGLPYPPGPPSWPIIGNLLDVPNESPWSAYAHMSKKYGDIICLRVYTQVIVVLCSSSAVKDLLEKRGEIFSERPSSQILEIMNMDWPLFSIGMTDTWRKGRKMLDGGLRPSATMSYRQTIEGRTRGFLVQLHANPKNFRSYIRLYQEELTMTITYGHNLIDGGKHLESTGRAFTAVRPLVLPGAALVNHFPLLRHIPSWVPYLSHEPLARTIRKLSAAIKNEPIDLVKNALHNGIAVHSLTGKYLQESEDLVGSECQKQEEVVAVAMGSMYRAGLDTNVSAISSLFLALTLFPRVQKRAQAELDDVIGRDRLPTFDDKARLPYIEALCKELLRWKMVTPLGLAHSPNRDSIYRGFFIPKGATIIADGWAILHDPEIYPDPEEFRPERFLNEDGSFRDDPTLSLAFGVGKRICPGRHLAEAIIFLATSSVLSVFDVVKAKDQNGNDIPVKAAASTERRVAVHLEEFQCSILPRDKAAETLILEDTSH